VADQISICRSNEINEGKNEVFSTFFDHHASINEAAGMFVFGIKQQQHVIILPIISLAFKYVYGIAGSSLFHVCHCSRVSYIVCIY